MSIKKLNAVASLYEAGLKKKKADKIQKLKEVDPEELREGQAEEHSEAIPQPKIKKKK